MKTSIIQVRDMLSVLSVFAVEKRIGEVPGVESVTVNHAAGNATVRYDETRLKIADIKSAVRQSEYESASPASVGDGREGHTIPSPAIPSPAAPKSAPDAAAAAPANTAPSGDEKKDKVAPDAMAKPSPAAMPASAAPKSGPVDAIATRASAGPAVGKSGKAAPDKKS